MTERRWTLEGARALLPDVRERTAKAVAAAESIASSGEAPGKIEAGVADVLERWAREMDALGLEVKGPWLVDFDSGSGYFCWKWPEESLDYFHTYEEGFAGRTRIQ